MADQVLDPERAMFRDAEKKKLIATRTSEVVRETFVEEYVKTYKKKPDLTNPMMNIFFHAWISAQGERKWLTPEEQEDVKKKQILNQKRRQTMIENGIKRRGTR
jgi:hypothetical protein